MFDLGLGGPELLIIAIVAIIVVGPRELPKVFRTVGRYVGQMRRMATDFRRQMDDAMRESEFDDLRKSVNEMHTSVSDVGRKATAATKANPVEEFHKVVKAAGYDTGSEGSVTERAKAATGTAGDTNGKSAAEATGEGAPVDPVGPSRPATANGSLTSPASAPSASASSRAPRGTVAERAMRAAKADDELSN